MLADYPAILQRIHVAWSQFLQQGSNFKARWWFQDQSIVVVLLHSYDHTNINYSKKQGGAPLFDALARSLFIDSLIQMLRRWRSAAFLEYNDRCGHT